MATKHAKYNAINVLSTNNGMAGRFSCNDILDWVKVLTGFQNYTKIEQLCDGIAYCYIMNKLFPNSFAIVRVKDPAYNEVEKLHNLKLLQVSFLNCNVDHEIPMHLLVKAKFQDNFEFAVWFKKFADLNLQNVSLSETEKTESDKQSSPLNSFKMKKSIKVLTEKSIPSRDKNAAIKPFFAKPNFTKPAFDDSENQMPPPLPSPMKIKAMQHANRISDLEREISEKDAIIYELQSENVTLKSNQITINQPAQATMNESEKEAISDIIEAMSGCPDDFLMKSALNEILNFHGLIENEEIE